VQQQQSEKMALQLWETLNEAIIAYTGLSPATFFTLLALILAVYYVVSGLFPSSDHRHDAPRDFEPQMEPLRPPVQIGEVTEEELKAYDGSDPEKPLLMAIKGQIYDVSQSRYRDQKITFLCFSILPFLFFCDFGFWVIVCLV